MLLAPPGFGRGRAVPESPPEHKTTAPQALRYLDVLEHVGVVADLPQLHDGVHQGFCPAFTLRQEGNPSEFWGSAQPLGQEEPLEHSELPVLRFWCRFPRQRGVKLEVLGQIKSPRGTQGAKAAKEGSRGVES